MTATVATGNGVSDGLEASDVPSVGEALTGWNAGLGDTLVAAASGATAAPATVASAGFFGDGTSSPTTTSSATDRATPTAIRRPVSRRTKPIIR
ncbi:hypothetical protein [Frankia sp. R82]|uniref:hypothetical protein n=1 Tax=Frankia sp. R82 TaxID=2950553 RepID=UPI0020436056|nr:hypothetical protein [Frankia sp. R82]MCM3886744.1 hypothetical protein [Frankia sp. R82]